MVCPSQRKTRDKLFSGEENETDNLKGYTSLRDLNLDMKRELSLLDARSRA